MKQTGRCRYCRQPRGPESHWCSPSCRLQQRSTHVGDCWIWTGPVFKSSGHGILSEQQVGYHLPTYVAMAAGFKKTPGKCVSTSCGNRLCVNPAHCVMVPYKSAARLTPQDVLAILAATGRRKDIAAKYGVHITTVEKIRSGHTWSSITGLTPKPKKKD